MLAEKHFLIESDDPRVELDFATVCPMLELNKVVNKVFVAWNVQKFDKKLKFRECFERNL